MHSNPRPSRDVRTGLRRLFASDAAADGVEVESGILRGFNGNTQIFAEEGRDLNPSLFHVENHHSAGWQFLRGCILGLCAR